MLSATPFPSRQQVRAGQPAQGAGSRLSLPPLTSFPAQAPMVALVVMLVVAVRIHEFFPVLAIFKPVLLAVGGMGLLLMKSPAAVKSAALQEPLARRILIYYGWALFTIPFALWPGFAFSTCKTLLPAILMFLAFLFVAPRRRHLDWLQAGFVFLVMTYAIYARLFARVASGGRLVAPGGMYDSNDMGSMMAMTFPLAAGMLVRASPGRARTIAAVTCVLAVLTTIGSGSRGGTLGLLAGALVFALGQKGMRGVLAIIGLMLGLWAAWATAPDGFRTRMLSLQNLESDYNYTDETGRKAVWRRARGYIRSNPVLGVGVGNFPMAEGGSWADLDRGGKWSAAHNAYLQAASELGLFGGGMFILILLTAARYSLRFWRASPHARGPPGSMYRPELLASLAAFSAGAYFLSHAYFAPLFALLGIIMLAHRTARAEALAGVAAPGLSSAPVRSAGQRGGLSYRMPVTPRIARLKRG